MSSSLIQTVLNSVAAENASVAEFEAAKVRYSEICVTMVTAAVLASYLAKGIPYPKELESDQPDEQELRRQARAMIEGRRGMYFNNLFKLLPSDGYSLQIDGRDKIIAQITFDPHLRATWVTVFDPRGKAVGPALASDRVVVSAIDSISRLIVNPNAELPDATAEADHE